MTAEYRLCRLGSSATSAANEFGQLAQGVGTRIKPEDATYSVKFIAKDKVPKERIKDVTYGSFRCNYKPNKEEKYPTRPPRVETESITLLIAAHQQQT